MLATILAAAGSLSAQVPQLLYYKFNEGSGATTANSASPGIGTNPAAISGTTSWITPGQIGSSSLNFAGTSHIATNAPLSIPSTQSWTIEFWIRPNANTWGYIFGDGDNVGSSFAHLRCSWYNLTDTIELAGTNDGIGTSLRIVTGPILNTWHHFAFVYDHTASTISTYWNGVPNVSGTYTTNISGSAFILGRLDPSHTAIFNGAIDEFRFWTVARSQAEILAGMNNELPLGPALTAAASAGTAASVFSNSDGGGDGVAAGGSFTIADNDDTNIGLITLDQIELTASGSGNDSTAYNEVSIYRDHDSLGTQGSYDPGIDVLIDTVVGGFPTDNGVLTFDVPTAEQGSWGGSQIRTYFVVAKFAGTALPGDTFAFSVTDLAVSGHAQAQGQGLPSAVMSGFEIDTPSFVFADVGPATARTVYLTFPGVCQEFTISYPAGPDDKPANLMVQSQGTADEVVDLVNTQLWWDSDNDQAFTPADTLIDTQVFTQANGSVTFDLSSLPAFQQGDTRRFFVVYNLGTTAANNSTFQCRVFSMGPVPLGGTASGLPLAYSAGLEISAAIVFGVMNGPAAPVTVDSNAGATGDGVLLADVTLEALPGGSWDFASLVFNAAGSGSHNTAYFELGLYEDSGNGTWDGPGTDSLAAPLVAGFSANVAAFDLSNAALPAGTDRRFFLVARLNGTAASGDTFGARLTEAVASTIPPVGSPSGFPTPASTALVIDVPALSVANSPEQPSAGTHAAGTAAEVVAASFRVHALNGGATVNSLLLTTGGTGDWSSDIDAAAGVQVFRDNGDGIFGAGDTMLAQAGGAATVTLNMNLNLATGEIADLWVVLGLTASAGQGVAATPETFSVRIDNPADVGATTPVVFGMPAPQGIDVGAIEFSVSTFEPATGLTAGGQALTIQGSGFMAPFTVTIGGTACPGTASITGGTQVTGLTIPAGFGQNLPIVIRSGTLPPQTLAQTFSYTSPKDSAPPKADDGGGCTTGQGSAWALLLLAPLAAFVARRRRA